MNIINYKSYLILKNGNSHSVYETNGNLVAKYTNKRCKFVKNKIDTLLTYVRNEMYTRLNEGKF